MTEANRIYVYERLYHHSCPSSFPCGLRWRWHVLVVAALDAVLMLVCASGGGRSMRASRAMPFVAAMVGIAAVGMLIAMLVPVAPDFAAGLLRFYWFRMSDVMVPAGVALVAIEILYATSRAAIPACGRPGVADVVRGGQPGRNDRLAAAPPVAACGRLHPEFGRLAVVVRLGTHENTPTDAVFLTPRLAQTFRWYAERAEVVNRKDIPQDAPGIVEWWRRNLLAFMESAMRPSALACFAG